MLKEKIRKVIDSYENELLPEYEKSEDQCYFYDNAGSQYYLGLIEGIKTFIEKLEEILEETNND